MAMSDSTLQLLRSWTVGDEAAGDLLFRRLYDELRTVAHRRLAARARSGTLQTTELVHEAYLRMAGQHRVDWKETSQFFAVAARVMRRIIVDRARARLAEKRGAGAERLSLSAAEETGFSDRPEDLVALDQCLLDLARHDPEMARLVELRFFAGFSLEETAELLGWSRPTVVRRWRLTKGWLHRQLSASLVS